MTKKIWGAFLALYAASAGIQAFPQPKETPDGQMMPPPSGFGTVPDEKRPELSAVETAEKGESKTISDKAVESSEGDRSVLLAKEGSKAKVSGAKFKKTGDTSNDGQSNFYGLNAAVVSENGQISLSGVEIETDGDGANAVFSTGEKSVVSIRKIKISTKQNSSRGLDSTYGGTIRARDVEIETRGAHSAAFATDRGEGTVSVFGGKANTSGEGSPVIYSTGKISARNLEGVSANSEIAVIEGKNSISIERSKLTGGSSAGRGVNPAVMLYQSMSGDAGKGTSVFSATSSVLKNAGTGPFFYVTNTDAKISVERTKIENPGGILIQSSGNESERGWGKSGENGGNLTFSAKSQRLSGKIVVDEISSVNLEFGAGTEFSGSVNEENSGIANLTLSKKAKISITGDSYFNRLNLGDAKFRNVKSNGHTLFYNQNSKSNRKFGGKTIELPDGGKIAPYSGKTDEEIAKIENSGKSRRAEFRGKPSGKHDVQNQKNQKNPPKNEAKGEKPNVKIATVSGTLNFSGESAVLKVSDEKSYTLEVLSQKPDGRPDKGERKNPPPKDAKFGGKPEGNRPTPPDGMNKMDGNPPRPVTLEELKKLDGKAVQVKAIEKKDGTLLVLEAEEK